jgi:hypothetical protein
MVESPPRTAVITAVLCTYSMKRRQTDWLAHLSSFRNHTQRSRQRSKEDLQSNSGVKRVAGETGFRGVFALLRNGGEEGGVKSFSNGSFAMELSDYVETWRFRGYTGIRRTFSPAGTIQSISVPVPERIDTGIVEVRRVGPASS